MQRYSITIAASLLVFVLLLGNLSRSPAQNFPGSTNATSPPLNCSNPLGPIQAALCNVNASLPNGTNSMNGSFPTNGTNVFINGTNLNISLPRPPPNVPCHRCFNGMTIGNVFDQFRQNFLSGNQTPAGIHHIINELRGVTRDLVRQGPLQRDELWSASYTLGNTVRYFMAQRYRSRDALDSLVDTFNDILDTTNRESWSEINDESTSYTEQMLQYAEECGQYMGSFLDNATPSVLISKPYIVFKADMFSSSNEEDSSFPSSEDLVNSTVNLEDDNSGLIGSIKIPGSVLQKLSNQNGGSTQVVHILMNSIQDFLPDSNFDDRRPASVIISSQVVDSNSSSIDVSNISESSPVEILFELNENATSGNYTKPVCVSWKYSGNSSQWVSDGIRTVQLDDYNVRCESTHLTSFAVLVGVSETTLALSIVSYIGCGVSIVCLLATVIFLITLGKALFTEVHNFIHLNLSLALLLGMIVFVAGIETAASNEAACNAVAFILHYFFLSAFCWMLCEGVMLYLMIVVVFSKMIKRWWLYLIFAWGLPLIPPAVTIGVRFDNYTSTQSFCWLGTTYGIIWSFIGPMLLIIAINFIILIIILVRLGRIQWQRRTNKKKFSQKAAIGSELIQGMIVLLPLLGLTWVFGLLAVDENTQVFAWLFTIFNSLQGLFIFFFHVLKSKRVWGRIKKWYQRKHGISSTTRSSILSKGSFSSTTRLSSASMYQRNSTINTRELDVISEVPEIEEKKTDDE